MQQNLILEIIPKLKKVLETFALNEDETYSEGLYRFFSHGESLP
jgi:hypothetical protein